MELNYEQEADTYWADDFECEMESRIKQHDSFLIATMVTVLSIVNTVQVSGTFKQWF
jgi:hypothetical protein